MDSIYEVMFAMMKKREVPVRMRQATYFQQMSCMAIRMFEYDFAGDDWIDPIWLERYLIASGGVVIDPDKKLICEYPSRTGDLDQYGDPKDAIGVPKNGETDVTGKVGSRLIIGYNNAMRSPDLDLLYYPSALAGVDKSIDKLVDMAGWGSILNTPDSIAQTAIDAKIKELQEGKPVTVLSENVLQQLARVSGDRGVLTTEMTDPNRIRNVQYLSELWDVLLRRYCNANGLDTRKSSKHAQVSIDEATGMDAVSWALPIDKLLCRQKMIDDWNRIAGKQYSVRFGQPWREQWEMYTNQMEMMEGDETNASDADDPDENDSGRTEDSGNGTEDQ